MLASLISQRYAKALLLSCREQGLEDRVLGEASALAEALGEDRDVKRFLSEPLSTAHDKLGVLLSAFPEPPHALTRNFLGAVMENRRERFLPQILREFLRLARVDKGALEARLTTAFKLGPSQQKLLESELSRGLGRKVQLIPVVDRRLIGGGTLQVEDTIWDGSLRGRLAGLEAALRKEPRRRARRPAARKKPRARRRPARKKKR